MGNSCQAFHAESWHISWVTPRQVPTLIQVLQHKGGTETTNLGKGDAVMIQRMMVVGAMVASICLPGIAAAADGVTIDDAERPWNQLRCDALGLHKQASKENCSARCLQRGARVAARGGQDAADTVTADCEARCEDRYNSAMQRVAKTAVCGGVTDPPPDPNKCAAKLLMAQAAKLTCVSNCDQRFEAGESWDACEQSCEEACDTTTAKVRDLDICVEGPADVPGLPQ